MREDVGRLLLRVMFGGFMLFHGVNKLGHGIAGITKNVLEHGLPSFVAYGVLIGEVAAPLLIVLGLFTRPAALVFAFNMVVAIYLSHMKDVLTLNKAGGWAIELQMLYLLGGLAIALFGAGRYSLARGVGRFS